MAPASGSARQVSVSYECLPSTFSFAMVEPELRAQVPLRNLHWKSNNRSIRTIQQLPVKFQRLSELGDDSKKSLLERPYLHLLFVCSDDNEAYRATLRGEIREWLDGILARRDNEWLIVHVTSSSTSATAKFYQRKGSVVDKIRADFNSGKRDRCVQVAQNRGDDPTAWAEFGSKVKEGIVTTFDANVALYEEDVRKADSQRQLEGWQYLTFFLQKEGLADSFEAMNLIEDALIQYDELEASFFQNLKDHSMAWFGNVGGLAPGDDSLPLLNTGNKPYREMIARNSISIFDFRIYLFARQAVMLSRLGRVTEVAKRGAYFISTFARTLRESERDLGTNFVESWTYSACLNIADTCQSLLASSPSVPISSVQHFTAVKAELLELARKQLDKIGIGAGHLPPAHPFSMSLNEARVLPSAQKETVERPPVSRLDLLGAIQDEDKFDRLYTDVTNRAIQAYQTSGRKRCSLKLHASLAALEDHRQRYSSAQKLYSNLPAHYVDLRWVKIESSLLTQCTRLQGQLDMAKERLLSTLALIRAGVEQGAKRWSLEGVGEEGDEEAEERRAEVARGLMGDVYELSSKLSKDFAAIAFPTFSMRLKSDRGETAQGEDGVTVQLVVQSLLPCELKIDEVRLKFSTDEGEQVWFTVGSSILRTGENTVTLFCPTAICGKLSLELSQIRFSRIIFQYSHRPATPLARAPGGSAPPGSSATRQPTVHFPRDHQALDISTELQRAIKLDRDRCAVLVVCAGRNEVTKCLVKLSTGAHTAQDMLGLAQATVVEGTAKLSVSAPDTLVLESFRNTIKIELPIIGANSLRDAHLDLGIVAEYFTSRRPATRRTLRRQVRYPIGLPLAVNVQDFFRSDCLLSKFTVTTDGTKSLKVLGAQLQEIEGVTVRPCRSPSAKSLTVHPRQTATFLFKITRDEAAPAPAPEQPTEPFRLVLTYASLQDSLLARVNRALDSILADAETRTAWGADRRWFEEQLVRVVQKEAYATGAVLGEDIPSFGEDQWKEAVASVFAKGGREALALEFGRSVWDAIVADREEHVGPTGGWRTLSIPVDLPALDILNLVSLEPAYTRTQLGLPLPVTLYIQPTFAWARTPPSPSPEGNPLKLTYDLTHSPEDWLVSGRKKGQFEPLEGETTAVELTLVPLRPGKLYLPSVAIRVAEAPRPGAYGRRRLGCETQHLNAAMAVEVLPVRGRSNFRVELPLVQLGEGMRMVEV